MSTLAQQIEAQRRFGETICQRLREEIDKLGFASDAISQFPRYDKARCELVKDPYTGAENLACYWYNASNGQRVGRLQFNSDGSFYAEYDLIKPHPSKKQWFVEGVSAWGKPDAMKAEAKLLPQL